MRNIKYLVFVFIALAVSACDDDILDTRLTNAISAANALATETNMSLIINGMHRTMYSQSQTVLPGGTTITNTARANEHYWV